MRRFWSDKSLLYALILISLIPVWSFKYIPSTDGGSHLENASILMHYGERGYEGYARFYIVDHRPIPNVGGHLLLALLMTFASPPMAEKILVTLFLIAMPLSFRYAVRSIRRGAGYLGLLGVPLAQGFFIHAGFYNFCLGVVMGLVVFGYWYRRRERMTLKRIIVLALLTFIMYLCHLFAMLITIGMIGFMGLWLTAAQWRTRPDRRHAPRGLWRPFMSRCALTFLALLPTLALAIGFQFGGRPRIHGHESGLGERLFWVDLLESRTLTSFGRREVPIGAAFSALLAILGAACIIRMIRKRRLERGDGMLALCFILTAMYFKFGDDASIHLYIPRRLLLYILFAYVMWIACRRTGARLRGLTVVAACLISVSMTAWMWRCYRIQNPPLAELTQALDQIPAGSTFLPLPFKASDIPDRDDWNTVYASPYYTPWGAVDAERRLVNFRNYEANTDYFPVRYRPALNPYQHMAIGERGFDNIPVEFDLRAYARQTGVHVDYILLWDMPANPANPDYARAMAAVLRQVHADYDLVYSSPHAQLWRHRGLSPVAAPR